MVGSLKATASDIPNRQLPAANLQPHPRALKQIVAVVKPFLVESILEGLSRAPLEALVVREVKGVGKQKSYLDHYGESEYAHAFLPKVEIVLWVDDSRADEVIERVVEVARTGRMGDGKIFVSEASVAEIALSSD